MRETLSRFHTLSHLSLLQRARRDARVRAGGAGEADQGLPSGRGREAEERGGDGVGAEEERAEGS